MFEKSPFFSNEKVREEIRKHKWIESEKKAVISASPRRPSTGSRITARSG